MRKYECEVCGKEFRLKSVVDDDAAFSELYVHNLNEHGAQLSCLCKFGRFRYVSQEGDEKAECNCITLYRKLVNGKLVDVEIVDVHKDV